MKKPKWWGRGQRWSKKVIKELEKQKVEPYKPNIIKVVTKES